ncbi:hypothetical protein [Laspinema palackyanum]|uniref:hypothetical protein n=1 Tax=Laspinema palackyanum TaxID=3231601 RepID=UPI00349F3206
MIAISLPFFLHFTAAIKNRKRYSIILILGIFIFIWAVLNIKNIFFGDPESIYMLFFGIVFVVMIPIILLRHPREIKYLEFSLLFFAACVTGYAILHYLVIVNILGREVLFLGYEPFAFGRVSGILVNPLNLGPFLITFVNYILFCQKKNQIILFFLVISTILILLTGNRSSFGLLLLTFIVYEFFQKKKIIQHLIYLAMAIGVIKTLVPPNFYDFYINRGLAVFSVLFGQRKDESFSQRGEQNAENLSNILTDPLNFIFGPGYSSRVTDSDIVSFLTHYGVFFTIFFYGLIIAGILFIGIPKNRKTNYDSLRIFLTLTTVQILISAIFVEGITSPVVSGYYFAFFGVAVSLKIHYKDQLQKIHTKSSVVHH